MRLELDYCVSDWTTAAGASRPDHPAASKAHGQRWPDHTPILAHPHPGHWAATAAVPAQWFPENDGSFDRRQVPPRAKRLFVLVATGMGRPDDGQEIHRDDLEEEATHVIDEARMILPSIQATTGFRFIAAFNQKFEEPGDREHIVYLDVGH